MIKVKDDASMMRIEVLTISDNIESAWDRWKNSDFSPEARRELCDELKFQIQNVFDLGGETNDAYEIIALRGLLYQINQYLEAHKWMGDYDEH